MSDKCGHHPLGLDEGVSLLRTIPVEVIARDYESALGLNVREFFGRLSSIQVLQGIESGLTFYSPANITGDEGFYAALQAFDWYYIPWKWEHETTLTYLSNETKILEIGSGNGGFMRGVQQRLQVDICGLELNGVIAESCVREGLDVRVESVHDHSEKRQNYYDVVCSFQVLEHIAHVNDFLKAKLDCLKKGGRLIISVPNNTSFMRYAKVDPLNRPPHHMILWEPTSLKALQQYYDIILETIVFEPLQSYHYDWYINIQLERLPWWLRAIFIRTRLDSLFSWVLPRASQHIKGHTMLAVYRKL